MTTPWQENELKKVKRAVANRIASQKALEDAIWEARQSGVSLRKLAEASGLSHETVRKFVA